MSQLTQYYKDEKRPSCPNSGLVAANVLLVRDVFEDRNICDQFTIGGEFDAEFDEPSV